MRASSWLCLLSLLAAGCNPAATVDNAWSNTTNPGGSSGGGGSSSGGGNGGGSSSGGGGTGSGIIVSPAYAVLAPGEQVTFTASDPSVSWSIATASCGAISADGVYTAPSLDASALPRHCRVVATSTTNPSKKGLTTTILWTPTGAMWDHRPFAANSPWNTPTPASTVWYDSRVLHTCTASGCTSDHFRHWWITTDFGITWAKTSDPTWTFNMADVPGTLWHRVRPATTLHARAPTTLKPLPSDDLIIVVVDPDTGDYIEAWNSTINASALTASTALGGSWGMGNVLTGQGVGDLATNLNAGVRAANFSWAAGLITAADLAAGKIDHALVLALPAYESFDSMLAGGTNPGPFRAPATCGNGAMGHGPIIMGSKIGVPAGVARPAGLSKLGDMMFDALQTYGAYVGDGNGGPWAVFYADGPGMGIPEKAAPETTVFEPVFAYWNYGGKADMDKIGPLLRIADYQPAY